MGTIRLQWNRSSRGDEEMRDMWRQWRRTRGKPTSSTRAVQQYSLNESWTAFVRRWNTEPSFAELVPLCEEQRHCYGLAETRKRLGQTALNGRTLIVIVRYPRRSARELGDTSERVMITNERMAKSNERGRASILCTNP
uniref:Uncharacterized protein n=1 Tax=Hyaloperonospora arabidopsidis (strain Emoy2) TaxID=559515 RepID=M4B9N7_HYAAE